jgi:hypothetical protein
MPKKKTTPSAKPTNPYTDISISAPPRTAETKPPAALVEFAGRVVDSYLAQRAAAIAKAKETTDAH